MKNAHSNELRKIEKERFDIENKLKDELGGVEKEFSKEFRGVEKEKAGIENKLKDELLEVEKEKSKLMKNF